MTGAIVVQQWASGTIVHIVMQQWEEIIVGTHCCTTVTLDFIGARMAKGATMPSDHIIASVTCVMWPEEHLWNVSVLQRIHLFSLVNIITQVFHLPLHSG
jgi:hypothetical protein